MEKMIFFKRISCIFFATIIIFFLISKISYILIFGTAVFALFRFKFASNTPMTILKASQFGQNW